MPETLEQRIEKLETETARLNRDLVFLGSLIGIFIAFIKNTHGVVDVHEIAVNQLIQSWYNETSKQNTVDNFLRDIKDKFMGGGGGHTPK